MSRNHRLGARLAALGATLMLLAGCSSTPSPTVGTSSPSATATPSPSADTTPTPSATPTPSPSSTAACTAASAFGDALASFKDDLQTGAAVEDVRAARDQMAKALTALDAAPGDVSPAHLDALKAAETRLDTAVKGVANDDMLAPALGSLNQVAGTVQTALNDVLADISC